MVPQIYRSFRLRSARDVSYLWQVIYATGLAFTLTYLIIKKALAAWVFIVVEITFCFVFVGMKAYFEQFARRGKNVAFSLTYTCFGGVKFDRPAREAVSELIDVIKEVLGEMSFQPTHHTVKVAGEQEEEEPVSLRGIVQAYVYMNDFIVEARYSESAEQLLVQITAHKDMPNMFDLSDSLDLRLSRKLPGAFLLNHGSAG